MTFIFRNITIFWDIPKWNRGQTKWDRGSNKNKTMLSHKIDSSLNITTYFKNLTIEILLNNIYFSIQFNG